MFKTANNPFTMVNFPKMMDPSKQFGDFSKQFGDFKFPGLDIHALMEMQRKNIAAITAVNQSTFDSLKSLLQRQSELVQDGFGEASHLMGTMMGSPLGQAGSKDQADLSKIMIDKCMATFRDASETLAQCNKQTMETLGARFTEGCEEMSGLMKAKPATP